MDSSPPSPNSSREWQPRSERSAARRPPFSYSTASTGGTGVTTGLTSTPRLSSTSTRAARTAATLTSPISEPVWENADDSFVAELRARPLVQLDLERGDG